ncbi:MAG TPA: hypothetical protein VNO70_09960 [Blastocatellia bacterium]|nr:hypothetical protein [Blastocatellia bacterium]
MTKKELQELVEKNLRKHPHPMIDTETGLQALQQVVGVAERNGVEYALVGGIAMHLYGSPRLTKDVDVIASALLPLAPEKRLGFGGERYHVRIGQRVVPVDWIVRDDTARKFYESALQEAYKLPSGFPIVTPEWLIILKYIAGRFKDQQDAVYLLKQKGLVDRRLLRRKIIATAGREYWALVAAGLQRWYDLADGRITTEKEDYEAGRL